VTGGARDRVTTAGVTLERVSEHAWWAQCEGYQTTVVVSGTAALLLDPLSGGRGPRIRDAVRSVLGADVTAVAYSHAHRDHAGDAAELVGTARGEVAVLAARDCAARLPRLRGTVAPTRLLDDGAVVDFHGVAVEACVVGGHTADSTWFRLPDEGVLHLIDLVHPGQAEFDGFGMAPDLGDYRAALRSALEADWRVLTAGHGLPGTRGDVMLVLDYLADLKAEVADVLDARPPQEFADAAPHNYGRIEARVAAVQADVVAALTPRWGGLPGFGDAAPSHVKRMFFHLAWFG
jgi:glyoxylase-like metal-dependent hydrolase (beta-lactamase superfamily II)